MGLPSWTPIVSRGGFNGAPKLNSFEDSHLMRANKLKRYTLCLSQVDREKAKSVLEYKTGGSPGFSNKTTVFQVNYQYRL